MIHSLKKNYLAIDASNIRHGGGITHLSQLIEHTKKEGKKFDRVYLWASQSTLNKIPERVWLQKKSHLLLNGNLLARTLWQKFFLRKALSKESCSALFVLGGSIYTDFKPVINFHQNLLPFETEEIRRYGLSIKSIKFYLLGFLQSMSMKKSDAVIYLSEFSKKIVEKKIKFSPKSKVIYHGIESRFFQPPKKQKSIDAYSDENPYRIIYVSSIDFYKHQWNVVEAVSSLREEGYPLSLELYGISNKASIKKLNNYIDRYDKGRRFVKYFEEVNFKEIHRIYQNSDLSVFASSCETFGQIVLESMSSGIPVACSSLSSMHEIIKDGCVYFDPLVPAKIAEAIKTLLLSTSLRESVSAKAFNYAKDFSWDDTSENTFKFLKEIQEENF